MKLLWALVAAFSCGTGAANVNDQCARALPVTCGRQVTGDSCQGVWDGTADCIVPHSAPQLWYYVDVVAGQLQVSLCNALTNWDTEISIFSGSNCGLLTCYNGVDDGCVGMLYQSFLNIPSVPAGRYYIMVHGFAASCGAFGLDVTCSNPSDSPTPLPLASKSPRLLSPPGGAAVSPNPSGSGSGSQSISPSRSGSPLTSPSWSPNPSPPINEQCIGALPVQCGATVSGSTALASFDGTWDCGVVHSAPQLWFYVDAGIGQLQVSTCNAATWDTQISVYSGTDCGNLTCYDGVDDGCAVGLQTLLIAPAIPQGRYYIMVHGFGAASGSFALNVLCTPAPSFSASRSMSPRSASRSMSRVSASRSTSRSMSPVSATPSVSPIVSTSTSISQSVSQSGLPSNSLSGSQSMSQSRSASPSPKATNSPSPSLSSSQRPSPSPRATPSPSASPPPANAQCPKALPLQCGATVFDDTSLAAFDGTWDCVIVHSAPQVWYYVDVAAGQLLVSTCGGATWDTQISVYNGLDCTNLTCYDGVDDGCATGLQSLLDMPAVPAGRYYIMVHGFGAFSGSFALTVQCTTPSPNPSGSMSPVSMSTSGSRSGSASRSTSRSNSPRSASRSTSRSTSASRSTSPMSSSTSPSPAVMAAGVVAPFAAHETQPSNVPEVSGQQAAQSDNALYGLLALIPAVMAGVFFILYRARRRTPVELELDYCNGDIIAVCDSTPNFFRLPSTGADAMISVQLAPCPTLDPTYISQ